MSSDATINGKISHKLNLENCVEWTIEDIFNDTFKDNAVDKCYSPRFSFPGYEWQLGIYSKGQANDDAKDWIGLFLLRIGDDSMVPIKVNFDLGVKRVDGEVEMLCCEGSKVFDKKNRAWGRPKFLQRSKLSERKSQLAPLGALTVTCNMRVKNALAGTSRLMELSDNFKNMFLSAKGCDATFKVQNETFPVHSSVLVSRSSVFESMFELDMKEKREKIVDIVDCDPEAFKDFLVYMYSGQFKVSSGDTFELYKIAHKYFVEDLKSACVCSILSNLSVDNVIDVVIFGDLFDLHDLKIKSQDFFEENFAAVIATDKWISLLKNNFSLVNQLLTNMAKNMEMIKKKC